jgi:hypothetical protein
MNKTMMTKENREYQAQSDLGTLIEAEKIKKDKTRFAAAMKCRSEKMAAMAALDEEKDEH